MSGQDAPPALPEPPFVAVIFTSRRAPGAPEGYAEAADRMDALAQTMPGYLRHDSVRDEHGFGITISYWRTPEDVARWRAHPEHAAVIGRAGGGEGWYDWYESLTADVRRISRG